RDGQHALVENSASRTLVGAVGQGCVVASEKAVANGQRARVINSGTEEALPIIVKASVIIAQGAACDRERAVVIDAATVAPAVGDCQSGDTFDAAQSGGEDGMAATAADRKQIGAWTLNGYVRVKAQGRRADDLRRREDDWIKRNRGTAAGRVGCLNRLLQRSR